MTLTIEYLLERVEVLENTVNLVLRALNNVATREALSQILLLKQRDIEELDTEVEDLKTRVSNLETDFFK